MPNANLIAMAIVFLAIIVLIAYALVRLLQRKKSADPYQLKPFLSAYEYQFYKELEPIAEKHNYVIMSKVRLADLVEVKKGFTQSERQSHFNKIQSKHVDFVFCDKQTIKPTAIIEVDDKSHNRPDRIKRDQFIDNLFKAVNLPILHLKNIQNLENQIIQAINPTEEKSTPQQTAKKK